MSNKRAYMIGVPRTIPESVDVKLDVRGRKWVKASDMPKTFLTQDGLDNMWYVWFKTDNVPFEDELVFDKKITLINRYKFLLRASVELGSIY
jgi:hypothetical protein